MTDSREPIFLVDGSAYIYRAYHAIRSGLSTQAGLPTNAVFGFTQMLIRLLEEKSPAFIGMLFDVGGPTFRHEMYPAYKANRPPMPDDLRTQLPYIRSVVEAFSIPVVEMPGFEADDVAGTLARQAEERGFRMVLVTGDKDYLQLVTPCVTLWDSMKDKATDEAVIAAEFGVAPERLVDVMALAGDTSDNVPGVPGIGMKTAVALIHEFGTLDALYERVNDIPQKKRRENLVAHRENAFLSRRLVTIRRDAPVSLDVEALRRTPPDETRLAALFDELEFRLPRRILGTSISGKTETGPPADTGTKAPGRDSKRYTAVFTEPELADLCAKLRAAGRFAVDTETTSEDPMRAVLVGVSVALNPDEAFYLPVGHVRLDDPDAARQLPRATVLAALKPLLEDPDLEKVGQNIKYDALVLSRHGVEMAGIVFDTMVASYLLDPGKRAHNLDRIAEDWLGWKTIPFEEVAGKGRQAVTFDRVLVSDATPYSCEDADVTLLASRKLAPALEAQGLSRLMDEVELPLIPVLMKMEKTGILVDRDRLAKLSALLADRLDDTERLVHEAAGERFNIHSSQQLGEILFTKLKLPVQKKTKKKTGYSTDVEVLTDLARLHELPALVLRHRTLAKLKSTYADALTGLIHPETGRIHTSYNQAVTATGRLSSSDPNLQNIPVRTEEGAEIRRAFVPREGWNLISADYSQIELRLLAHYAKDPILTRSFEKGEDIHARTASEVFGIPVETVSPELRRQAKTINFGILYGMGAFSLSKELGISRPMAQTYIEHYFARYAGIKAFIDETIERARRAGRIDTLLGRIRPLPDITSSNHNIRAFAERTAVNTPIQGTAADFIKLAMIRLDRELTRRNLRAAILLTVHDELVLEAPPDESETVADVVRTVMEHVWPDLTVPLVVNVGIGRNWAEIH